MTFALNDGVVFVSESMSAASTHRLFLVIPGSAQAVLPGVQLVSLANRYESCQVLVLSRSSYLTLPQGFFQYSSVSSLGGSVFMLLPCHWE